MVRKKKEVRS